MKPSGDISRSGMGHVSLAPVWGVQPWAEVGPIPVMTAQANVPESASLAMGVVCALVGWWMVDRKGSKETRSNR